MCPRHAVRTAFSWLHSAQPVRSSAYRASQPPSCSGPAMNELVLVCPMTHGPGTQAAFFNGRALPTFDDVAEIPMTCPCCRRKLPDEASSRVPGLVSWQPCQCVVCLPCAWKELLRLKGTESRPSCPACGRLGLSLFFSAEVISQALPDAPRVLYDIDDLIAAFSKLPDHELNKE